MNAPHKQTLWQVIGAGCRRLLGTLHRSPSNANHGPIGLAALLESDTEVSNRAARFAPGGSGQPPRPPTPRIVAAPSYTPPAETTTARDDGRRFLAALDSGQQLRVTNRVLHMLAPMPGTAIKLLQLLSLPDVSIKKVAALAGTDVGLTSALLRRANSAVFSFSRSIGAVDEAIKVIGLTQTRSIVLASGVSEIAQRAMPL